MKLPIQMVADNWVLEGGDPTVYAQAFSPESDVVSIPDGFQRTSNAMVKLKDELAQQNLQPTLIVQKENTTFAKISMALVAGFIIYKFFIKKGK